MNLSETHSLFFRHRHKWILLAALSILPNGVAQAEQSTYENVPNCISAKVVSGDTCSNVKVEVDFSKCFGGTASMPPVYARIICSGKTITARASKGEFRAESRFKKSEDGWGSINWEQIGAPKTLKLSASEKVAPLVVQNTPVLSEPSSDRVPAAEPSTPASVSPISLTATGFFDMRYTGYRSADASINEKTRSGFLLEDGALYFSVKKDNLEAAIDLPFSRNGLITSDTSDLSISKTKSQIYGRYHFSKTMNLTFGQFDTVFGFELNDSKDRVFGNVGLAYSQTLPIVHSGAYLSYAENGFTLRALVANPSDRQTFGTDPADSSTEYGGIAGYANEWARLQIGFLTRAVADLANGQSNRTLFDNLLGFSFGSFHLDFQYSVLTNPRKNTLTAPTNDKEDPGSVAMALLTYQISDRLKVSGRLELLDRDPAGTNYPRAQTFAMVGNYLVQDGLTVRLEWNDILVERTTAAAVYDESRWELSGVVTF